MGLVLGLATFLIVQVFPPPEGMSAQAWHTAAVAGLMAIWWITEAVPVYATGLLPLALFPLLGILDMKAAAAPYANPLIFLFLGGFMIALAMQRWGLHRRIALSVLGVTGTRARNLIAGFMLATGFLSMWVSNTATTMMMLPIALSVLTLLNTAEGEHQHLPGFNTALLLSVAYGASIGGLATLIGTPPNALLAAYFLETYGVVISFVKWMAIGAPLALVLLALCWFLISRVLYPLPNVEIAGVTNLIESERDAMGPISRGEAVVLVAFIAAASLWILRPMIDDWVPQITLTDPGIAMSIALLLFVIPVDFSRGEYVLNWEWAQRVPWGILLLFGGGLSLAAAATQSGFSHWVGDSMGAWSGMPLWLIIFGMVSIVIFLTEVTSNTATTATLIPLLAGVSVAMGQNPLLICIPTALAASCAFMLPPATPPNAIIFGSGQVTIPQMARAGLALNLLCIFLLTGLGYTWVAMMFDIEVGVLPSWVLVQ